MKDTNAVSQFRQPWSVRRIVVTAMLAAITVLLAFTPVGMIPMPPPLPAVTLVHLPVIVAVLLEGPVVGVSIGFVFGISSLIRAWSSAAVGLTLFFRNPLVSVVPRMLIPLVVWGVYQLLSRLIKNTKVGDKAVSAVAAALGALTNTVLCLGMIVLLYGKDLTEIVNNLISVGDAGQAYLNNAGAWLVAVVGLPNGIAEVLVAAILIPIIKIAVEASTKRYKRGKNTKVSSAGS
ncbi:MAG TPA: ECF transporter S component [Candidatus Limiplasma sp.]|nr:ECF transporter S component [Candidatus Limiplasma sp.]